MSGDFIDSNVILYLFVGSDLRKRDVAERVVAHALREGDGWISFQVVQEVLNTVTRRTRPPAAPVDSRRLIAEVLMPLWRVMPGEALYRRALDVHDRYGYGFYDSLIIAAALGSGCDRLYSEDLQAGQRIERLRIENPFA
jgi:predicted nucleic acid-binding protein